MNKFLPQFLTAFVLRGWLTLAVLLFFGWLRVEYLGPVWIEWLTTSAVIYFLGTLGLASTVASGFISARVGARARLDAANNAASIEAAYLERIAAAENELERMRALVDPVRDAMPSGMTDADLIAVCDAYEGYRSRWYEIFGLDISARDHPRKSFPLWWQELLNPAGAEMNEYAEYLNRREEATQLGHTPDYACLTFNQWKDRVDGRNAHWREKLAYHPTSPLQLPDKSFLRRPSHPDFYHLPQGFTVINADL